MGEYVETYEHRLDGARVTDAAVVHHRNGTKDDNTPANLEPLGTAAHGAAHRRIDRAVAVARYERGETLVDIAQSLGCHHAALSRALRSEGVQMRSRSDYAADPGRAVVKRARSSSRSAGDVAAMLGVTVPVARRLLRQYGLPSFPSGRPR